jgi:hypothetical protein
MSRLSKSFVFVALFGVFLVACASQPTATPAPVPPQGNNPYAPQPGDEAMTRGDAEIISSSVLMEGSSPPQISVPLAYRLPTPCHQLRVSISQPDSQNRIKLDVYGLAPKDKPCNLMALNTPLETNIGLGSFLTGHYSVWVNGQQAGEFDVQ